MLVTSLVLCLLSGVGAEADTLTVGSGVGCDFPTLEAAIDSAAAGDVLQIADPPAVVPARIVVKDLTLRGGYAAACDGSDSVSALTTLLPGVGARLWSVANAQLTLDRLELREADNAQAGGIVFVTGSTSTLVTVDVSFTSNAAASGGAIFLTNGAALYAFDTNFTSNSATSDGAAIYCQDSTVQLYGTRATLNSTPGAGGVLYAQNCATGLFTSALSGRSTSFTRNSAHSGAVIWADDGAVEVTSFDGSWILMDANSATSGGVFYSSGNSALEVSAVWASNNDANSGGVLLSTSSTVPVFGLGEATCAEVHPCNVFENNLAWFGAVLMVSEGAHVRSSMAVGNDSSTYGSFYLGTGNESHGLLLESSVIAVAPVGSQGALIDSGGPLELRSVSILDNEHDGPVISHFGGAPIAITQSIVWESGDVYVSEQGAPPSEVEIECNIVNNTFALPAGSTGNVAVYPWHVLIPDIAAYWLEPQSSAIDMCDDASVAPAVDIDHNPRPSGPRFDAGAWEDPAIFRDGFELGDTQRWTSPI